MDYDLEDMGDVLDQIAEQSHRRPIYVVQVGEYTTAGGIKRGDDLEADYLARNWTAQATVLVTSEESKATDFFNKVKEDLPSAVTNLGGDGEYSVLELDVYKDGVGRNLKRAVSKIE